MARLDLTFEDTNGHDVVFSFDHADPEVYDEDVSYLMQTMIINGSIFSTPPVRAKSAKLVPTTTQELSIS